VEPPDGSTSLEELLRRARGGSPDAWEAIYLRSRPQLFRYARLRLVSDDQTEDAVSETIARAIAGLDRFPSEAPVMAWLVGICRNVVLETHRSGTRQRSLVDRAGRMARPTESHPPDDRLLATEEAAQLRRCFDRLDDDARELLELRVVVGLDADAVAAVVGKRPGAVRMAQSRALARLRGCMEEAR
jgi:RNA polymerase sigma-70 factor (ECF subfamily)